MRVRDLLGAESIELQGKAATKKEVIEQMVQLMAKRGNINDLEKYEKGVFAREEEGTTGIGEGIAIPHCKSDAVSAPGLAAMVLPQGVDYDALNAFTVQFHPEACAGPLDASYLFDRFMNNISKGGARHA